MAQASSRSRSYYDSDEDDYSNRYDSDEFVSDDDIVSIKQPIKEPSKKVNPYLVPSKGRGRGRGRGRNNSQNTQKTTPRPGDTSVAKRMMSANRIKMNEYRNQVEELHARIKELTDENKTLKKMQFRHQRALGKFEEREGELPQLLTRHSNEVRALREQNRKMKEKYATADRYLRDAEDELDVMKVRLKKYKTLAENKGLPERDDLNRKVHQTELDLEDKNARIKELERHIEMLNKNHRHEIGIEIAHHRETKKHLKEIEGKQQNALVSLREKEKELEIKNIYSNRIMKPPHKLPASYNGTPHHTPPPARRKRNPSLTDLSSKDKAKLYEERRKDEDKQAKLDSPRRQKKPVETWTSNNDPPLAPLDTSHDIQFDSYKRKIKTEEDADTWVKQQQARIEQQRNSEKEERIRLDEEMRQQRERMKRESEEIERLENERAERLKEEDRRRLEMLERERIEREKEEYAISQRERQQREKEEQDERELRLEQQRLDQQLLLEQQKARQELQAEAERERLLNDPKVIEERRKKDLLLARMKQIDDAEKTTDPVVAPDSPQRAKFIGSNKDKDNSFNSHSPGLDSNSSIKSAYSFTKPTVNLHNGLPSHDDVTVPYLEKQKKEKSKEDMEIGGYRPSFASKTFNSDTLTAKSPSANRNAVSKNSDFKRPSIPAHRSPDRKAKLMNDLFGKKSEDKTDILNNDSFKKTTPPKQSGFPWDDPTPKTKIATTKRENSSTLFGGGSALINDDTDLETDKSKMLPRRIRQPSTSTFSSKPVVNAIDNFDDDIEEVML